MGRNTQDFRCCWGTGDAVAVCTELFLTQKHLVILRKVRAQKTGVLKTISDSCPNSLPCAGAVLDHLERVLMPETGHGSSYHLPLVVLYVLTLHLCRASFSEGVCEGEVHMGWSGSLGRSQVGWELSLLRCNAASF